MRRLVVAGLCGIVFGIGLGISGMTQPSKVIGFLDLFGGRWDPSLAFVMGGAIAVHMPLAWLWRRTTGPKIGGGSTIGGSTTGSPTTVATTPASNAVEGSDEEDGPGNGRGTRARALGRVNLRLVVGAAIFGVGWGLGGYCPGPALVTLVGFSPGILVFVASMMLGMWIFHLLSGRDPADLPSSSRPPASVTALPWVGGGGKD